MTELDDHGAQIPFICPKNEFEKNLNLMASVGSESIIHKFKSFVVGDDAYIISSYISAICGESLHPVKVISIDGGLCGLRCLDEDNNPIGDRFIGDIRSLYKSKNDAINAIIQNLESFKEKAEGNGSE